MPYDTYKSTDGQLGGGASAVGPNRTIGDIAGEATQRKAVTLNSTGSYVQWTSREQTNTFVLRYSIPDSASGGGTNATLDLYANGQLVQPLNLTSHYAWLYGSETSPGDSPCAGSSTTFRPTCRKTPQGCGRARGCGCPSAAAASLASSWRSQPHPTCRLSG